MDFAKGGHLQSNSTDLLISKDKTIHFKGKKIKSKEVHGTGCTLLLPLQDICERK